MEFGGIGGAGWCGGGAWGWRRRSTTITTSSVVEVRRMKASWLGLARRPSQKSSARVGDTIQGRSRFVLGRFGLDERGRVVGVVMMPRSGVPRSMEEGPGVEPGGRGGARKGEEVVSFRFVVVVALVPQRLRHTRQSPVLVALVALSLDWSPSPPPPPPLPSPASKPSHSARR